MTIDKAIKELVNSDHFRQDAMQDAKLRMFQLRFRKGELGMGSKVKMLERYGYKIDVTRKNVTK